MKHLNGNILAVVDCETTGCDPTKHDILEICVLPLNKHLEPSKTIMPFNLMMIPRRKENIDFEALRCMEQMDQFYREQVCKSKERIIETTLSGIDQNYAAELLVEWFEKLQLAPNKRIMPIAHNWVFDRGFIIDWIGQLTFDLIFDPRYRDTMSASLFMNDFADYRGDPYPFQKNNLQYLCSTLHVERERSHTAIDDCIATAEVYRRMVRQYYGEVPKLQVLESTVPSS